MKKSQLAKWTSLLLPKLINFIKPVMNTTCFSSEYFNTSIFSLYVLGKNHRQTNQTIAPPAFASSADCGSNSPSLQILTSTCQDPARTHSDPPVPFPHSPLSPTSLWDAPWFCFGSPLQEEVNKPNSSYRSVFEGFLPVRFSYLERGKREVGWEEELSLAPKDVCHEELTMRGP